MASAYAQLQWMGHALLRAQGFARRDEQTGQGRRFSLYERAGSGAGPTALLVHGLGGSATSFTPIARQLCSLCKRVLLIDLPGHGTAELAADDQPADPLEMAQALGRTLEVLAEPVLLVGNSLGGALVLSCGLFWPEQVAGVIALAPAGAPLSRAESEELRRVFRGGAESGAELGRRLFHSPPWAVRMFARGLGEHIGSRAVQHIVRGIRAGAQGPSSDELRAIRVPTLVLWGDSDGVLPSSGADYFRGALPVGSFELLERTGHLPQIERPRAVLRRIAAFISKPAPGAVGR